MAAPTVSSELGQEYSQRRNSPVNNGVQTGNRTSSKGDSEMRIGAAMGKGPGVLAPGVQGGSRTSAAPGGPTPARGGGLLTTLPRDYAGQLKADYGPPTPILFT